MGLVELFALLFGLLAGAVAAIVAVGAAAIGIWAIAAKLVPALLAHAARRRARHAALLGLPVKGGGFAGTWRTHAVRATHRGPSKNNPERTTVAVELPDALGRLIALESQGLIDLPGLFGRPDTQVGDPAVDRRLRVQGAAETARGLLLHPAVRDRLLTARDRGTVRLERGTLYLLRVGRIEDRGPGLVEEAVTLAEALGRARRAPWEQAAERLGLALDKEACALTGAVDGIAVTVREEGAAPGTVCTVIEAALPARLPAGTHISREGDGVRLGDPILDGALAIRGDPAALRDRLADDDVRGALMAVCHAHPGSVVSAEAIRLRADGRLMESLEQAIRDVVDLARALERTAPVSASPRSTPVAPEPHRARRPLAEG